MNDKLENEIQNALQPAPMDEKLTRRLRVLAHETPSRRRNPFYLPASMAAGVAAVVVVTTMLPAKASAKSFDLIVAAAQRVDAFQFSIVSNENAKREYITIAGSGGQVYMRAGDSAVMEFGPGSMSVYDPDEKKVMRFKLGGLVDVDTIAREVRSGVAEGLKEMDLKKMLQDYRQKYGEKGVRISPITSEGGRRVYHVTLASQSEPERVEMTVDAATDLPDKLQVVTKGARPLLTMEMRFGARVDPRFLRSSIPAGAKVEEIDLGAMVGDAMKGIETLGKEFEKMGSAAQPSKPRK